MRLWEMLSRAVAEAAVQEPLWRMSPTRFMRQVLGLRPWKAQRAILGAVARGDRRVSVYTGHGVGKTLDAAALVCWACACADPPPVVVSTAPTFRQVRDQLWREVNRLWSSSPRLRALGECLTTRLECTAGHYAVGFSTREAGRFQGIHAPRLLFIVDEANALPEPIWEAIDACLVSERAQVLSLGNPIVPYGHFFRDLDREGVTRIRISSRDHPNVVTGRELIPGAVTRQWIANFERDYRSQPGVIRSRVDGLFPESSQFSIVQREWLRRAVGAPVATSWPTVLACDVARFGNNLTALARQRGQLLAGIDTWEHASTTETTDAVEREWRRDPTDWIVVDDDGVGGGVTDQLEARGLPVFAFHNGGRADQPERFADCATEAWWAVRDGLEKELLSLRELDYDLELQLTTREYEQRPRGPIKLESKGDYKKRTGFESPDKADAWAMACWMVQRAWRGARAA